MTDGPIRLTVLVDNTPGPGLRNDWGLSILVETPGWRSLFDADTDPAVLEFNVEKLGVDLASLDYAVLSHYHFDHTGGFSYVAAKRPGLTVYVPPGPVDSLKALGLRPVITERTTRVAAGAHVIGPLEAWRGFYEQAFAVELPNDKILVLVGCSHPGADKLAKRAAEDTGMGIHAVLGGYHSPPSSVIDRVAEMADKVCPGHCSGEAAKNYAASRYPDKYCEIRTGLRMEFGNP